MDDHRQRDEQAGTHQARPQAEYHEGGGHPGGTGTDGGPAMRGVTRPMSGQDVSGEGKEHTLRMHYAQTLWVYWLVVMLGFWMILAPLTFSYGTVSVSPSGGREVWLSLDARVSLLRWSDLLSGFLLVVFGWRGLRPNRPISLWICCFVGIWLQFAPLVFWAPSALVYVNDTLVGVLVIALTVLVAGMPNMILYMKPGPVTPPGWSYNPSSWPQRAIMIGLGLAGWLVSRYLAAFQLGFIASAWDPFFGAGTEQVLNSAMSHSLPISDGGLGALAYTFEFLMGWMGSPARWRTMPWMVAFFGILVIPLGLVHVFLVISQPVVVGHWCTLCLLAACIMLPMIPLEVDEVIAMTQFMGKAKDNGESLWKAFWLGGSVEGGGPDERSPEMMRLPDEPGTVLRASVWGMSVPWTLAVAAVLGIFLMATPGIFGVQKPAADVYHLGGALIVVASVLAVGEPLRLIRYLSVPLGLAVAALPWFMDGAPVVVQILGVVAGLAAAALSIPRGPKKECYGSWDRFVR